MLAFEFGPSENIFLLQCVTRKVKNHVPRIYMNKQVVVQYFMIYPKKEMPLCYYYLLVDTLKKEL